jgi:predicted TIM-barrel fold metal-dependent hydrolase
MSSERDNTPPPATIGELKQVLGFLHLDRVVIVTPEVYGEDNSATTDAITVLGRDRARGIALISESFSPAALVALKSAGIVGFRVFLDPGSSFDPRLEAKRLQARFDLAERLGWHLDISAPPEIVAAVTKPLAASPVPLVFDYFGWAAGGVEQPGFDAVLSLVESGRAYVKLSEPYRLSRRGPDYPNLAPVAKALVSANADRVLWGSGWPHVSGGVPGQKKTDIAPDLPIDAGHLLNLLSEWVPDAETRHKILVDNPARLYGFQAQV